MDIVTKSKLNMLIGTKAYKKVTVRNINITRKKEKYMRINQLKTHIYTKKKTQN